ncbi:prothymosin alpha isoform X2 [Chanos chanos]|uniref:Prothymosin alpha isoform X2 n=1 Tax=Chanos chanos TaxID=29144 RepID=A0A6J2VNF4_CHACN|nr:prothymosin alpha-like isoform X2 [Chanos chanos]
MADAAVDTTTTTEINTKDLKGKQEAVEEVKEVEKENGSGDAPANGNGAANGASHDEETPANEGEEEGDGEKAENGAEEPADSHAVKRPAEEEESADTKKQKTENGDSTEAEVKA